MNMIAKTEETRRLVSVREAFAYLKVGRSKGFQLIHDGSLTAVKFGNRFLVDLDSIDAFIASLPSVRN
jgi:excisionase family DNA binding protein